MNFRKICILLVVVLPAVFATDYCRPGLCGENETHIACGNNEFAASCGNIRKTVALTPEMIDYIVLQHNKLRNQMAEGLKDFPTAARMATMEWDDELAHLAELNVRQCKMKHDKCRSTDRFPYSGQNLAYFAWYGYKKNLKELVDNHIQAWFNEYKYCDKSVMLNYPEDWNGPAIGHLTAMVQEKNNRVGCAAWRGVQQGREVGCAARRCMKQRWEVQYFTCNYAYTNIINKPVYKSGKPASNCTKRNPQFTSLCSTEEKYDLQTAN